MGCSLANCTTPCGGWSLQPRRVGRRTKFFAGNRRAGKIRGFDIGRSHTKWFFSLSPRPREASSHNLFWSAGREAERNLLSPTLSSTRGGEGAKPAPCASQPHYPTRAPQIFVLHPLRGAHRDTATVAQASQPAVPQVSQLAGLGRAGDLPTGKSATQQVWKPALRTSVGGQGVAGSRHAPLRGTPGNRLA
jgi:hypothetical protein